MVTRMGLQIIRKSKLEERGLKILESYFKKFSFHFHSFEEDPQELYPKIHLPLQNLDRFNMPELEIAMNPAKFSSKFPYYNFLPLYHMSVSGARAVGKNEKWRQWTFSKENSRGRERVHPEKKVIP